MTAKKSIRSKKSTRMTRAKKATTVKTEVRRFTDSIEAQAIFLVVICVLAVAIVIAARRSGQPAATTAAAARPAAIEDAPAPAVTPTDRPAMPATSTESARTASFVTISGCLEQSDETFRLTDTAGDSAPRARSWKSGFLKKSPAALEVVDVTNRLKLPRHVGERVSLTGTLVEREMQVRTLQRVGPSCSKAKGPQA